MTFKGGSKGAKGGHLPNAPEMAQNLCIPRYNKKTKQLSFIKFGLFYLSSRKQAKSDYFSDIGIPLSGSAIDDPPTFLRNFYKKGCMGTSSHPISLRCGPVASRSLGSRCRRSMLCGSSPQRFCSRRTCGPGSSRTPSRRCSART